MRITSSLLKCDILIFLVLSVILWACVGYCGEGTEAYNYNPAGKLDPFKPFIVTVKEKAVSKSPLSPLQKIGIDQFKLVGIARSGKKRFAIVEDSKGKRHHYTIYRSTPIGLNEGRVINILDDQVIIEERIKTPSGEVKIKPIIWKLHAEENEEKP